MPIVSPSSAISTFVWLLALGYLYTEMTTDERAMGAFILPLLVALQAISALKSGVDRRPRRSSRGRSSASTCSSLSLAYASLGLACMIGVTYVLLFKEIKAKQLGFFYARLPSLQVLDTMNQRAVILGWVFLTIGLIAGFIWTPQARAYTDDPRMQGDVSCGSDDFRRRALLGRLFFRSVDRAPPSAGAAGVRRTSRRSALCSCS